jgi:hypothetical protein
MASLEEIRVAIADALAGIDGVQSSAYQLSAPTPPCFFVQPFETNYDTSMQRGLDTWTLTVTGLVSLGALDIGSQKNLDQWLAPSGDRSVKATLEADVTLGGVVESLTVPYASEYRVYQREGGGAALGVEWRVVVRARGDE